MNPQHAHQAQLASVIEMLSPECEAVNGNCRNPACSQVAQQRAQQPEALFLPRHITPSAGSCYFHLLVLHTMLCILGEGYCIFLTVQKLICFDAALVRPVIAKV